MKFGLLGHKIAYSLSPVIHEMISDTDISYEILDISPEEFNEKLPVVTSGLSGFNITIPHKQAIIPFCDTLDDAAAKIGAVNTVDITEGRWKGYNTDYLGFIRTVKDNIPDYLSYHPVIVGYGGVARAVTVGLEKLGFTACSIFGGELQEDRRAFIGDIERLLTMRIFEDIPSIRCLWINCTPVGGAKLPVVPEGFIPFGQEDMLYDLNYAPSPTHLEEQARGEGLKTINGLQMLVSQAIEARKIWVKGTQTDYPSVNTIIRSLQHLNTVS